jgi:DNA-binding PadR family transcriptional regulator
VLYATTWEELTMTETHLAFAGQPSPQAFPPRRRGSRRPIGPFAYLVLCAIRKLPAADRYGLMIEDHVSRHLGQLVDLAQVYVSIRRLEKQKLITGKLSKTKRETGHKVTLYTLTAEGKKALGIGRQFYERVHAASGD